VARLNDPKNAMQHIAPQELSSRKRVYQEGSGVVGRVASFRSASSPRRPCCFRQGCFCPAYFASSTGTSSGEPSTYIFAESKKPATFKWNWTTLLPLFCQNQP